MLAGTHLQHVWRADSPPGLVVYDDGGQHNAPPPPSDAVAEPGALLMPGDAVGEAGATKTGEEGGVGAKAGAEAPEVSAADATAAADADADADADGADADADAAAAALHAESGGTLGSDGAAAAAERVQADARPSRHSNGARHAPGGSGAGEEGPPVAAAAEPSTRHADADVDADVDEGGGRSPSDERARQRRASAELLRLARRYHSYAEELQGAYRSLWLDRQAGGEGAMPEVALRALPPLPT